MDIPRLTADWLARKTGIRSEAEPSAGNIKEPHFIVQANSFWVEPHATTYNTEHNFSAAGAWIEGYQGALELSIVYRAVSSGEVFRSDYLEQSRKNALFFSEPKVLPIIGGKVYGRALEMMRNHIPDIDEYNVNDPVTSKGYVLDMGRDPGRDKVFQPVKTDNLRGGYIAEQAFLGAVFMWDGAERVEV